MGKKKQEQETEDRPLWEEEAPAQDENEYEIDDEVDEDAEGGDESEEE